MGIFCQINLFQPPDGIYHPGQSVSGIIKYAVDEPMEYDKVVTSLKGIGKLLLRLKKGKQTRSYRNNEVYVDIDNIIHDKPDVIPIGAYEIKFNFKLPYNLPSTTNIRTRVPRGSATCKIQYYIRIKFERPGFFAFDKHFRKEITVIYKVITAELLREPVIYGATNNLIHLCSCKNSFVNIKATILNSVLPIGGKIDVQYEVENRSSIIVKSVETKLIEIHKFKALRHREVKKEEDIPNTDSKTLSIQCGDTQTMPIEINVPPHLYSLDHSKIVSRDYAVKIEAALPIPHRNVVLIIPVEIGTVVENVGHNTLENDNTEMSYDDPPPSYWEAMGEAKKESDDEDDN